MDVLSAAKQTAQNIDSLQIIAGRNPLTVAGVSVYIVTQLSTEKKSITEIANAVNMKEGTIKGAYKDIYMYRKEILPIWWKHKESLDALHEP